MTDYVRISFTLVLLFLEIVDVFIVLFFSDKKKKKSLNIIGQNRSTPTGNGTYSHGNRKNDIILRFYFRSIYEYLMLAYVMVRIVACSKRLNHPFITFSLMIHYNVITPIGIPVDCLSCFPWIPGQNGLSRSADIAFMGQIGHRETNKGYRIFIL